MQLVHTLAVDAEYLPAAHVPVTAVIPVVAQYLPARHAVQLGWPLDA